MEPAIPEHLQVARTRPAGVEESYVPPTRSFSARFRPSVTTLPMVYHGIQVRQPSELSAKAIADALQYFDRPGGPSHHDRAEYIDEAGYHTTLIVAYWNEKQRFEEWSDRLPLDWWRSGLPLDGDVGAFRECFTPGIVDTETTFSHPHAEGYSMVADGMSGEVREHGYWGSARDRIPKSQVDGLGPLGQPSARVLAAASMKSRHVIVEPHENLCLLRSGQDWSETEGEERRFYLDQVQPILEDGMVNLRDEGRGFGCLFNRYVRLVADRSLEKTYSMSAWRGLDALEAWARSSTQHLAIFGAGTRHYSQAGPDAKLRLYHEMSVIRARDQLFEYFNCHPRTGMLNAVSRLE